MYKLIIPTEEHSEDRFNLYDQLKKICNQYPNESASQLADIIYASIDSSKYHVGSFPAKRSVGIYHNKTLIALAKHYEKIKEVLNA